LTGLTLFGFTVSGEGCEATGTTVESATGLTVAVEETDEFTACRFGLLEQATVATRAASVPSRMTARRLRKFLFTEFMLGPLLGSAVAMAKDGPEEVALMADDLGNQARRGERGTEDTAWTRPHENAPNLSADKIQISGSAREISRA
jgi:hypothetical protein